MLIAPSEPPALKAIGRSSPVPERFGVDVLFATSAPSDLGNIAQKSGIQRKEYKDLLASKNDGRLQRELAQMIHLDYACLVIEGEPKWTLDGQYISAYGTQNWTRQAHHNLIASVQARGVQVQITNNLQHTIEFVGYFHKWITKPSHNSLDTRPKPKSSWGRITTREFARHLLQSFDGIGPTQAEAIIDYFGGVPLVWMCTEEQLRQVPGIGPVRARKLAEALEKI